MVTPKRSCGLQKVRWIMALPVQARRACCTAPHTPTPSLAHARRNTTSPPHSTPQFQRFFQVLAPACPSNGSHCVAMSSAPRAASRLAFDCRLEPRPASYKCFEGVPERPHQFLVIQRHCLCNVCGAPFLLSVASLTDMLIAPEVFL